MASLQEMKQRGGGAVATAKQAIEQRVALLTKGKEALGAGASTALVVEREIRAASVMIANSRDLQEADPRTIYTSVSIAINSGIGLCNGHGYLVAYKGKCSFVPGWKGLVDLVSRSGRATVWTGVVYRGDHFEYELGANPFLRHKPEGDSDDWKDATHVYAVGRIKNSDFPILVVWTVNKIFKHLSKFNKVGGRHYALKDDNNMEMYGRKVVLLQALKYLPSSQDLDKAMNADIAAETGREMIIEGDFSYVQEAPAEQPEPMPERDERPRAAAPQYEDAPMHDAGRPDGNFTMEEVQPQTQSGPVAAFRARLMNATDIDLLDADADMIREMPADAQADLTAVYKARREEIANPPPTMNTTSQPRPRRAAQMNLE